MDEYKFVEFYNKAKSVKKMYVYISILLMFADLVIYLVVGLVEYKMGRGIELSWVIGSIVLFVTTLILAVSVVSGWCLILNSIK